MPRKFAENKEFLIEFRKKKVRGMRKRQTIQPSARNSDAKKFKANRKDW